MEENIKNVENLIDEATNYGKSTLELLKLKAIDILASGAASVVPLIITILLVASFLLFLNLAIAFWLGDILGKIYYGFFIVGGFYMLVSLIVGVFFRKRIKNALNDSIIRSIFKAEQQNQD
jgi:uncharacterized membrane protein